MVTLQFVPYNEIEGLSSVGRIRKLLNVAKENKIVLLQGRLKKDEEAELIKTTMEEVNKDFKGIELAVIYPDQKKKAENAFHMVRSKVVNYVLGDRAGFTIIGPASVVKQIKQDPDKIELLTEEANKKKKKKK
jgi:hypothetical protein